MSELRQLMELQAFKDNLAEERNNLKYKLEKIKRYANECKYMNVYDGFCLADSILEIIRGDNNEREAI